MTQTLKLADEFFQHILDGAKRGTIRQGYRDIKPGQLMFESADFPGKLLPVWVTSVTHKLASGLSDHDAKLEGARGPVEVFDGLKRFYPEMQVASPVTVIEFMA